MTEDPHLFESDDDVDQCRWCGLPRANRRHSAQGTKINNRTKRMVYIKAE